MPADDADIERLRRERREAAAKDGLKAASDADLLLPDKFYKLPRIRFLLLLCKELLRINRFIITFGEDRFVAMDVQRSGKLNVVAARGFVKNMSPGASDAQVGLTDDHVAQSANLHAPQLWLQPAGASAPKPSLGALQHLPAGRTAVTGGQQRNPAAARNCQSLSWHETHCSLCVLQVSEHISTFVSTAEAAVRDIAPEQVAVSSVAELSREAFVAGVSGTTAIRDHIKVRVGAAGAKHRHTVCGLLGEVLFVWAARSVPVASAMISPIWHTQR